MYAVSSSVSKAISDIVEIPIDAQDEKKATLADALCANRANETSPSFEGFQNLSGSTDIKVLNYEYNNKNIRDSFYLFFGNYHI